MVEGVQVNVKKMLKADLREVSYVHDYFSVNKLYNVANIPTFYLTVVPQIHNKLSASEGATMLVNYLHNLHIMPTSQFNRVFYSLGKAPYRRNPIIFPRTV